MLEPSFLALRYTQAGPAAAESLPAKINVATPPTSCLLASALHCAQIKLLKFAAQAGSAAF